MISNSVIFISQNSGNFNFVFINRDECLAIIMEADDDLPITCMEFVRSAPAPDLSLSGTSFVFVCFHDLTPISRITTFKHR